MTSNNNLEEFVNSLDQYDWFCDAELDKFGRFVVYVDKMDIGFIGSTPDIIDGHHVLFHFIASQPIYKNESKILIPPKENEIFLEEDFSIDESDMEYLTSELDKLEKICGSNILSDIFFESHDQHNAITNLSNKFPEVRQAMDQLYNQYGFDIIYEQLDE